LLRADPRAQVDAVDSIDLVMAGGQLVPLAPYPPTRTPHKAAVISSDTPPAHRSPAIHA
jgi:hypothetical protein